MIDTDILIVGAGPVGAHAAKLCAEKGFNVVVIEKNERNRCGAQWVNGVPLWQLTEAGLANPPASEVYHEGGSFSLISPLGESRITIKDAPLYDLDMRLFGLRLLHEAEEQKGVRIFYEAAFNGLDFNEQGRPVSAATSVGKIGFKLIIDCSGLSAVVRKQVPLLTELCSQVTPKDLCTAAQEVREIADPQGAQTFLEKNNAVPGEALAWVNVAGGFSLMRVHIEPDLRHVAFLTGVRAMPGMLGAMELIRQFVSENGWVGKRIFGGQRPIPLRRPYAALAAEGVALLGDSGCQVYSAHASGIGVGLIAAQILSEQLALGNSHGEDIGSGNVLMRYAGQFHSNYGALLANSDASRRFSQDLTKEETHILIDRKLMTNKMIFDSLFQRPVGLHWPDLPGQALKAVRHPLLVRRVLKVAIKIPAITALMRRYPIDGLVHPEKLRRFESRLERIVSY